MSNNTITIGPASAASPHPSWCNRVDCDLDGTETYHSSTPVELKVGGSGSVQLTLVRSDEHAHPERWDRAPELCMIVESGPVGQVGQVGELAEVHLDLSDVPELVALFTSQLPIVNGCDHSYVIMDVPGPGGTTATVLVCSKCGDVA